MFNMANHPRRRLFAAAAGGVVICLLLAPIMIHVINIDDKPAGATNNGPIPSFCGGVHYNANEAPAGSHFFGPAIVATSAVDANNQFLNWVCTDPMGGSVVAQLMGLRPLPSEDARYMYQKALEANPAERVRLVADVQKRLKDAKLTVENQNQPYWTEFATGGGSEWTIHQAQENRSRTVLHQHLADGTDFWWSFNCHFQPFKPTPFTGVPMSPQPHGGGGTGGTPNTPGCVGPGCTPPPPVSKCAPPHHWTPFGGKWYCGTPTSGPDQQAPQTNNPHLVAPTPGYPGRGHLEGIVQGQNPKPGANPLASTPTGTQTGHNGHDNIPSGNGNGAEGPQTGGSTGFNPGTGTSTEGTGQTSGAGTQPGGF